MDKSIFSDRIANAAASGIAYLFLLAAALLPYRYSWAFTATMLANGLLAAVLIGRLFYLAFRPKGRVTDDSACPLANGPAASAFRMSAYFLLLLAILGPDTPGIWTLYVLLGLALLCTVILLVLPRRSDGADGSDL